ncbi:DUF5780 domain-containing protein [Lysinibacillus sp. NPDC096418]|uniref:DUF5780 domain-containing protein n=1 Tax=Lysinibacillus sp. NPDC096418 TaxID=3364138 RepID=UPI003823D717
MKCNKCGADNQNDSIFCSKCGTNLSTVENEEKIDKKLKNNKLNNKKLIFSSIIGLLAIIALIPLFMYFNNPVKTYKDEIRSNNYKAATEIYNQEIRGDIDGEQKVKAFLIDEVTSIKESFSKQQIGADEAIEKLETIKNTKLITSDVNETIIYIKQLNYSRIAYKSAGEFQKEKNYIEAIKAYKKVVKEDENYQSAQSETKNILENYKKDVLVQSEKNATSKDFDAAVSSLKEASELLPNDNDISAKLAIYEKNLAEQKAIEKKQEITNAKAAQLVIVNSSKIISQSDDFKTIYPDMIQVIIKNQSDKTIKSMNVGSLGYDHNGYPVKIKTQFNFSGGDYEFVGHGDDVNIVAGATYGYDVGWNLDDPHGISKTLSCVKSVTYYDGTMWDNPYYPYWLEEYKEQPLH